MNSIYRYRLNYKDFLKMCIGDLTQIQKYLFLQTQPIEVEVYLEELLLSPSQKRFSELGLNRLKTKYPKAVENLLHGIINSSNNEEDREHLKIMFDSSSDFLENLVDSYMAVIERSLDIQERLLLNIDSKYAPITIITNSVILNRLETSLQEFTSNEKVYRRDAHPLEDRNFVEIQLKNLNVIMLLLTRDSQNNIHEFMKSKGTVNRFYSEYLSKSENDKNSLEGKQYLNAITTMELFSLVLDKNRDFKISEDKVNNLYLPHFNSPSRNIKSDWSNDILKMPKSI